jgi:exonuclease VII small subunit
MILEIAQLAENKMTWYIVGISAANALIILFLQGKDSIMRQWINRLWNKGDKTYSNYEARITELQGMVKALQERDIQRDAEMTELRKIIQKHELTIQKNESTIQHYQNVMKLIESYMKKINPSDNFAEEFTKVLHEK